MTVMYEDYGFFCCVLLDKICKSCHRGFIQKNPSLSVRKLRANKSETKPKTKKEKRLQKKCWHFFSEWVLLSQRNMRVFSLLDSLLFGRQDQRKKVRWLPKIFLGCTLFCFGLLFLLNNFYSLKKNRFQGKIQSLIIEGGEKRSANELPARFE